MSTSTSISRILVPLDGSDAAMAVLPWIRALATRDSALVLMRVATLPLAIGDVGGVLAGSFEAIEGRELQVSRAYLDAVSESLADAVPDITRLSRTGNPADEILTVAESHAVDLILMPTHGRGATGRIIAGSVADRVARAASVPVMLVHASAAQAQVPGGSATCGRVIVPLDGSERARTALPVAAALARQMDAPVHLQRVIPTLDDVFAARQPNSGGWLYQRVAGGLAAPDTSPDHVAWYEEYLASAEDALQSEARRLAASEVTATSELLVGTTVSSLLDAREDRDVIVMTSHGEGGIRRWAVGSVAEQLLHHAATPLVLVPIADRERLAPAATATEPRAD